MTNEDKHNLTAEGNRAAQRAAIQKAKDDARRAKLKPRTEEEEDEFVPSRFSLSGIRNSMTGGAWKAVLMLLIFIFAVGSFLVGGGPTPNSSPNSSGTNANAPEVVANVAGQTISRSQLDNALQTQLQYSSYFGQTPTATDWLQFKQRALQSLQSNAAVVKAAQDANVQVTSKEIDDKVASLINERIEQESGGNMANFRRTLEAQNKTENDVRDQMRNDYDRDLVRSALLAEKYEKQWKATNTVGEADYIASVTQLNLSQIVVRAKPPLPNDQNAMATYTKNKADAQARAQKIADQIKNLSGSALITRFAQLARAQSDDVPTKTKGGALGFKLPSEVSFSPSTRDALAAVKTTPSVVGPLQDDFVGGSVLLLVAGKKPQLPKDYAKNKAKLLKTFEEQKDNEAWQKHVETLTKAATLELQDPALQAFKTQTESALAQPTNSNNAARNEVLAKYEQALTYSNGLQAAAIRFQMAQLYGAMKQTDKQIGALQAAIQDVPGASVSLHLELARVLAGAKRNAEAVKELQAASKAVDDAPPASSPFGGNPNDALRAQIAAQYEAVGRRDLAALERAKVKPAPVSGTSGTSGASGMPNNVTIVPGGATP